MELNIFAVAARKKLRFASTKGLLSTEQLWDLPLTSRDGVSLDAIAIAIDEEIQALPKKSFVASKANTGKAELELRLEILKHIIDTKETEAASKAKAASNAQEIEQLTNLLEAKQLDELKGLSKEEILARMQKLQAA